MEPVRRGSRRAGVALVLAAAVLWSTGGLGIKSIDLPPLALAGWRGLFALPVLVGTALVRARASGGLHARTLARAPASWVGVLAYATMSIAFVAATKLTTAADAIFIQYTSPAYVAILSWPLLRERVGWRDVVACVGVVAGMALFFGEGLTPTAQLGNAVAVVSSFGAAGLPLALRFEQRRFVAVDDPGAARVAPSAVIAGGALLTVLVCLPAMVATPPARGTTLGLVALLGLAQVALPYVLYGLAVPRLTALEGSILPTVEPILNPVWVIVFRGETPGGPALMGGACVLGGVLFQALGVRSRPGR
jgi:drug/metabolite transporter (DMT)-like permease